MKLPELIAALGSGISQASREPNVLNYQPNPGGQIKFHQSEATGRLLAGDNRSGKSVGGIVEDVWWLTDTHPYLDTPEPPVHGRVITVDFDTGCDQIIVPKLKQWIPTSYLIESSWDKSYNKRKHLLTLRNGSTLEIKAHGQDLESFAGTSRHFLHVDEECPKSIFIESKTRLIDFDGRYWITMTPVEGITWVYNDLVENSSEHVEVFEIDITDNPHVSQEGIDKLKASIDKEEQKIRFGGGKNFVPRGGLMLREFNYDRNTIEEGIPPRQWAWYVSIDHGYSNPSGIYWHALSDDGILVTFAEHYKAEWTIKMHSDFIHERNRTFGKQPKMYVGDPSMSQRTAHKGTSVLTEYREQGINVIQGTKKDIPGEINKMNEYLKQGKWLITKNCFNLIREIRKYGRKNYHSAKVADRSNKPEEPQKKDDHGVDSSRYLFGYMPALQPMLSSATLIVPKMSLTRTNPTDFPWKIDEQMFHSRSPYSSEPDVSFGEVI